MSLWFLALIAFIPIAVSVYMGYVQPRHMAQAMPVGCLLTAFLSFFIWNTSLPQIAISFFQGLIISLQLILFLICVIFCMETLRATGIIDSLRPIFTNASPDRRVQALLVAWFFEAGVESLFGFASTGGICTIILYGIGFPPACAIMLSVLGLMTASVFGAGGAPILFGVAQGMGQSHFLGQLAAAGWSMPHYLRLVSAQAGVIGGIAGTFVPLMMMILMHRFFGRKQTWTECLPMIPFALFCGLAFTIPYAYIAIYVGPQFPSLIGGIVGFAVTLIAARIGFLLPKEPWDFPSPRDWPRTWTGGPYKAPAAAPHLSLASLLPFLALAAFLVIVNWPSLGIANFIVNFTAQYIDPSIFPIQPVYLFQSLFLALIGVVIILTHNFDVTREALGQRTQIPASHAILNLSFVMPMIRLYVDSDVNPMNKPGMFRAIGEWLMQLPLSDQWGPFLSPIFGAATTHFSLNNVYSNMTLSMFQQNMGHMLNYDGALFVALQVIGASAGCMFAGHYLMGSAIAITKTEVVGPVGRKTIMAMIAYLILAGLAGFLSVHYYHLPERMLQFLSKTAF